VSTECTSQIDVRHRSWFTRIGFAVIGLIMTIVPGLFLTGTASAQAYTQNAYPPHNESGYAVGWASVVQDCTNTFGCWNYVKIEKWGYFGNTWIGGGWVTGSGWQSARGALPKGCGWYRTTVDSYNDVAGPVSGGANIGPVGGSGGGQKVYRYHSPWSSGWASLCS
jgi:hypothetical protein